MCSGAWRGKLGLAYQLADPPPEAPAWPDHQLAVFLPEWHALRQRMSAVSNVSSEVAVELVGVSVQYRSGRRGTMALRELTVQLPRRRIVGIVGPDGAGKTTLLRLLAGIVGAADGTVTVLGRDIRTAAAELKRHVAYMPQTGGVYDNLSVRENVELFATLYGVSGRERKNRIQELLEVARLGQFQSRLARHLSGGMRQKLALICSLLSNPQLLLLDEPGVGVDVMSRRDMWGIYRQAVQRGVTVVLSTTYMDEVAATDYAVVLDRGSLLYSGPPDQFTAQARGRVLSCRDGALQPRLLAARIASVPGVLDAVVEGDEVRVLVTERAEEVAERLRSAARETGRCTAHVAEPRFGEAFALALSEQREPTVPPAFAPASRSSQEAADGNATGSAGGPTHELQHTPERARWQQPAIEVNNVRKRFGRFEAIKGVTFTVQKGEIFGLLGANGAGKTTLFRMLCGVLRPTSGELRVAGIDATRSPIALRRRIGYMAQKFALYGDLTPEENLWFYGRAYGLSRRQLAARVPSLLASFGLTPYSDVRSGSLPLGFKQRLSLACAVVHDPDMIFLDEPTSGVDPLARREFWQRINGFAAAGKTVLVTTHFMEEAEYCDRMVILVAGRLLAEGSPAEIRARARQFDPSVRTLEDAYVALIEHEEDASSRAECSEHGP